MKSTKLPIIWWQKLPKHNCTTILADLHQIILVNFADEVKRIKTEFIKTDYLLGFVESIIRNFQSTMEMQDSFIIPPYLFNEYKSFTLIVIPFHGKKQQQI